LRTSGLRWHERFADCLCDMSFFHSKAEADIWMRKRNDKYEFIGVYVDDLAIVAHDPKEITDALTNKYLQVQSLITLEWMSIVIVLEHYAFLPRNTLTR
jgi:hypothetical protein